MEDNFPDTLSDLQVGGAIEVKFDPDSLIAFKIDTEEEEAEIDGIFVEVGEDEITIQTKRGRRLTLTVDQRTRIELDDDFPGTMTDLAVGAEIEAKFDPFTRHAFRIELKEDD